MKLMDHLLTGMRLAGIFQIETEDMGGMARQGRIHTCYWFDFFQNPRLQREALKECVNDRSAVRYYPEQFGFQALLYLRQLARIVQCWGDLGEIYEFLD